MLKNKVLLQKASAMLLEEDTAWFDLVDIFSYAQNARNVSLCLLILPIMVLL